MPLGESGYMEDKAVVVVGVYRSGERGVVVREEGDRTTFPILLYARLQGILERFVQYASGNRFPGWADL